MTPTDLSVLIVDDHAAMRALLRKVLERAGVASVREAATGEEALAALHERPAQLVLVDRNMPGMGGAEFLARVRAEERWPSLRIIAVTGDTRAGALAGADAMLIKPVSPRALLETIERVLASGG